MTHKKRSRKASRSLRLWLTASAICISLITGIVVSDATRASSGTPQKYSKDVPNNTTYVDVMIQPAGTWSSSLDTDIKSKGGKVKQTFKNFSARVVTMKGSDAINESGRTDVQYVSVVRNTWPMGHVSLTTGADQASTMSSSGVAFDGTGVSVAVLDSGIDPNHIALTDAQSKSRIIVNQDFTGELDATGLPITSDPYGHGTHVAALAAGNGKVAQNAYLGMAPNASVLNLRVLNSQGVGTEASLLSALDWVATNRTAYNIRVINMSLGMPAIDSYQFDPVCQAVRSLVNSGVVAVAAAGNHGKDSSGNKVYGLIDCPGNEASAITVGAANTFGTDSRNDDTVATFSSRGPTRSFWTDTYGVKHYDNLIKPDVVAPGNKIISAEAYHNYLVTTYPTLDAGVSNTDTRKMMFLNGTSMASPVVAGAAALLLQANPKLTPNLVKAILMYTAQQLPNFNAFEQGAGEINLDGAMRLALSVRTDLSSSTSVGAPLLSTAAPIAQSNIAGFTFPWSQGLILDYTYATGTDLITKYQKIYGTGVLLGDATTVSNGVLLTDNTMISSGVLLGDSVLTSSGITMSDGLVFCSDGVLLGDGVLLTDGVLLGDGVLLSDGVLLGDGVLLSDYTTSALSGTVTGDKTSYMKVTLDNTTTTVKKK